MQERGRFITLEGIEGVGKSTAAKGVVQTLEARGLEVVLTREPGGTEIAEAIRQILISEHDETLLPLTEMFLLFAGRHQHIEHTIKPALARGAWVLSDRFTDASYAYQGGGRQVPEAYISQCEAMVKSELTPDCVLWLDAPVAVAMNRMKQRGALDRFEQEQTDFFERARGVYAARHEALAYYHRIDATLTPEQMQQACCDVIAGLA